MGLRTTLLPASSMSSSRASGGRGVAQVCLLRCTDVLVAVCAYACPPKLQRVAAAAGVEAAEAGRFVRIHCAARPCRPVPGLFTRVVHKVCSPRGAEKRLGWARLSTGRRSSSLPCAGFLKVGDSHRCLVPESEPCTAASGCDSMELPRQRPPHAFQEALGCACACIPF